MLDYLNIKKEKKEAQVDIKFVLSILKVQIVVQIVVQTVVKSVVQIVVKSGVETVGIYRLDKEKNRLDKDKTKKNNKNKKEKKNETDFDELINENFSDEKLKDTIYEFIKMRKAIKKPLTKRGLELMIAKLYKLSTNIDEQIEIINNSIMNNWQGIFPLKNEYRAKNKGSFNDFKELWEEAKIADDKAGNNSSDNTFSW